VYPPGYKKYWTDIGWYWGQRIMKWHDVYALYYAFDKLLFAPGIEWTYLQVQQWNTSIDDLIKAVEALVLLETILSFYQS
jgi:hypothetical protein